MIGRPTRLRLANAIQYYKPLAPTLTSDVGPEQHACLRTLIHKAYTTINGPNGGVVAGRPIHAHPTEATVHGS